MNFSQGHSGTKVQCESCLFSQAKTHQNSQKWAKFMNSSFWALALVWFAGATPDFGDFDPCAGSGGFAISLFNFEVPFGCCNGQPASVT